MVTSTCALFEKLFILGLLGKENPQKESNKEEVHLENYSIERLIDFIRINDSYVMDYSLANEENLNLAKEYVQEAIQVNSKYAKYRYLQAQIIFYSKLFHKEEIDFDTFKTIKELLSLAKALENPKANDYEMRVNTYEQFGSYVRSYIEKGGVYSKTDLKLIKMKDEMLRYQVCPPPQYRIPPTARPGENYVFVSYSTKDFKSVYCDLISFASRGISFWYDAEVIPGEKWQSPVEEKIQGASCVICYLSENSLKSDAIYKEMELIKKYKKQVIWIDLTGKKQISKIIMHVMRDYPLEISSAITSDMLRSITELVDDNIDIISRDKDPRAEIHINRIEDVLQKKFSCTLKQIQSEHLSVANNRKDENQKLFKPNEDYVIDDQENHIYIVLDGILRKAEEYHNFHSLSADVSEIFAKEMHSYLLKNKKDVVKFSDVSIMLKDGFKQANHAVQIYLEAHQEEWVGKEIPGCVGIVTLLINQTLFYGSLGDCVGVLCRGDQKIVFSKKQTEFAFRYLNLETDRKRLYDEIVNQPQAPYGYGVINGNPCAVKYFDIGYLKIEKGDIVYLMSDGVSDYIEYNKVKTYKYQSLPHIIQGSNRQDEEMMKPYFDDKSIIKITLDNKAMTLER